VLANDLAFAGAVRQAELIASGEVSARELVTLYLDRINRLDPRLNAFRIVYAERALADACLVDRRRAAGGELPPLLGVPIAVKDCIDVAGDVTACGSTAHGPPARFDSEVVSRLRSAGAIPIGKTNVPELCVFPFTESVAFGITRNPWDLSRTPGGSSGGSAVAVAAGLSSLALGSDAGGSIRIPAAYCGLFGLKPQRDRISLGPADERSRGLGAYGPLTRTVRDAALLLDVTAASPGCMGSFTAAARRASGKLRIGISTKLPPGLLMPLDADYRGALDDAATLVRGLGHSVESVDPPYRAAVLRFAMRYLRGVSDDAAAMAHPERLEPRTRAVARAGALVGERCAVKASAAARRDADRINAIFERVDVLLTPPVAALPPSADKWAGRGAVSTVVGASRFSPWTMVWNHLGNPAACMPMGATADGLPLAIQLVGRPHDEETLFSLAAQIELERPWAQRRPALAAS